MASLFFKHDIAHCFSSVNGNAYDSNVGRHVYKPRIPHDDLSILRVLIDYDDCEHTGECMIDKIITDDCYHAAKEQRYDIVCMLIGSPHMGNCGYGVIGACEVGNLYLARLLMGRLCIADFDSVKSSDFIKPAAVGGHINVLHEILEHSPGYDFEELNYYDMLRDIHLAGKMKCFDMLIRIMKKMDGKISGAIDLAYENLEHELADLIRERSRKL